jgi:CheY-like chemotaxis protein
MKTILVVEDERVIAEVLSAILQDEGFHVMLADNGKVGLERMAEERPDVVLCDIMMPIIDGRDMVRAMASNPDYRSIPVIMMSAATLPTANRDYSYSAFLRKPFEIDDLISTVRNVLHIA